MPPRRHQDVPQDTTLFTGTPKWWNDMRFLFSQRDAMENERPYEPYGTMSDAEKAALNAKIAQATGVNPPQATVPVSITGSSKPVNFTPQELYQAAHDKSFARHIFAASTGNPNVTKADLGDFQRRIQDYHGDTLNQYQQEREQQHQQRRQQRHQQRQQRQAIQATFPAAQQAQQVARQEIAQRLVAAGVDPANVTVNELRTIAGMPPGAPIAMSHLAGIRRSLLDPNAPTTALAHVGLIPALPAMPAQLSDSDDDTGAPVRITNLNARPSAPPIPGLPAQAQAAPAPARARAPAPVDDIPLPAQAALPAQRQAVSPIQAQALADLEHRAAAERNIADLNHEKVSRTAPMNATQAQAKRMVERGLEQHDETFQTARHEIDASRGRDLNIPGVLDPYLRESVRDPDQFMDKFRNRYKRNVIDALRDEAEENFLEETMPHTNAAHSVAGTFHSGARQSALEKARQKTQRHLHQQIGHLLHQGEESAYTRSHEHTGRHLEAGQIAANAAKLQQEAHRGNAEQLGKQALLQKGIAQEDVKTLGSIGVAEQAQRQNEINEKKMEHEAEKQHALNQLERQSAHMHALPAPPQQHFTANQLGAPNPPNPWNLGNNILGTYAGLQQPQQSPGFAKGGHVRAKFADGGSVANIGARFNALGQHAMPGPYEAEAAENARQLASYRMDPIANHMAHIGAASANFSRDPGENYARGSILALQSRDKAHDRMIDARAKAGALYDKINGSRMDTHKLIADYDQKVAHNMEQQRHHGALESAAVVTSGRKAADLARKEQEAEEKRVANINPKTGKAFTKAEMKAYEAELHKEKNAPMNEYRKINAKQKEQTAKLEAQKLKYSRKNIFGKGLEYLTGADEDEPQVQRETEAHGSTLQGKAESSFLSPEEQSELAQLRAEFGK